MRPRRFSYTFATAASTIGFVSGVTGAINVTPWATVLTGPNDKAAHETTLTSAANLSGINITVYGTDAEDRSQSELIAGPNNTTKSLTKYFKTVTSVGANATLGSSTMSVGYTTLCATPMFPVDRFPHTGAVVGIYPSQCTLVVQQCLDPIYDIADSSVSWQTLIASGTASAIAQADAGITAVRCLISSTSTTPTLVFDVSQSGK